MKTIASLLIALLILVGGALGVRAEAEQEQAVVEPPPGKELLKLVLPKPMFQGTPTNIQSDNLDTENLGKSRGAFFVPEGTRLLSRGKPVTSSDRYPIIGELDFVTDGDKQAIDGSFLELGPGLQWVQVDLEARYALHAILVWHFHASARVYRDVIVQVSDDPEFKTGVITVFNNDHDNSAGLGIGKDKEWIETNEGKLIDPQGVVGRYVRFHSRGNTSNDQNHFIEVEVFGTEPAQ